MSLKKVIGQINKNKNFIITSHINLEADALGSQLAFWSLLKHLKKAALIVNKQKVPQEYNFLAGLKYIKRPKDIKNFKPDVLIVLDCADPGRCRDIIRLFSRVEIIINIDHHISNSKFGHVNWVDYKASSTVEMIYKLYKKMRIPLDKNKALWLYAGLMTDTGSFRYPNTTSLTHKIASCLLKYNLSVNKIYRNIYENLKFTDLKILSKILLTLQRDKSGGVIWFEIKRKFLKAVTNRVDLAEYVLNFGRLNNDAQVIILFKEDAIEESLIRVNLRSKDKIDVSKIAKIFGGGGHKNASGCTIKAKLPEAKFAVIQEIKKLIK